MAGVAGGSGKKYPRTTVMIERAVVPQITPHTQGSNTDTGEESDEIFSLPDACETEVRFYPLDAICLPTEHMLLLARRAAAFGTY